MAEKIYLTGDTYSVRDELKRLGCVREKQGDKWLWYATSEELAEQARALIKRGPTAQAPSKPARPTRCVVCGVKARVDARGYPTVRIYRSGECQDCYEERKMGY